MKYPNVRKLVSLFSFLAAAIIVSGQIPPPENAEAHGVNRAAVAPFGETLFEVYGNIGSVDAETRAASISKNIKKLQKDSLFKPEAVTLKPAKRGIDIVYMENHVIACITDVQAAERGRDTQSIAEEVRETIINAVVVAREGNMHRIIIEQVIFSVVTLIIMALLIRYVNRLYRWSQEHIKERKEKSKTAIDAIIDAGQQIKVVGKLLNVARVFMLLGILYVAFLVFLWIFPGTHWLASTMISYILIPLKKAFWAVWEYIPDLFEIIVIIVLFRMMSKALRSLADKIAAGKIRFKSFHSEWAYPTYQISRVVLIIFTFIFIFPLLPHSDAGVFKGISVFIGVLLSLGSTSVINNVVAGFIITYMRPFKLGDHINMGEHDGNVIEKNYLVTRIVTRQNEVVTIPNSKILTASTTNYTASAEQYGLILHADATVGYDIEWRKVHELLIEAASRTEGIMKEPKPFVLQTALDDHYVKYQLNAYTNDGNGLAKKYSGLYANIQDVFNEAEIELMSPYITGSRPVPNLVIPEKYIHKGEAKPEGQ